MESSEKGGGVGCFLGVFTFRGLFEVVIGVLVEVVHVFKVSFDLLRSEYMLHW